MGLRAGDVVLRVSGQSFNDPSEAMDIFRSLAEGDSLTAEISRGGHQIEIQLDGSLITGYPTGTRGTATPPLAAAGTN
jgi:S1-C subfamily serine protease